jgi:hypothetical protein
MSDTTRSLEVVLEFKDKLTGGTTKALAGLTGFGAKARAVFSSITQSIFSLKGAILGIAGAFTIHGITSFVEGVGNLGRRLLNMSKQTGISVETLSRLNYVADQTGTTFEELGRMFSRAEKNIALFTRGGGEAGEAMHILGKDIEEAARRGDSFETLLPAIAERFNQLEDAGLKNVVAMQLFGRSGFDLIPILSEGRDGIEKLWRESDKLGLTWKKVESEEAKGFMQSLGKLHGSIKGLLDDIVKPLLKPLSELFDTIAKFVTEHSADFIDFLANMIDIGQRAIPAMAQDFLTLASSLWELLKPMMSLTRLFVEIRRRQAESANSQADFYYQHGLGELKDRMRFGGNVGELRQEVEELARKKDAALKDLQDVLALQNFLDANPGAGLQLPGGAGGGALDKLVGRLHEAATERRAGGVPAGAGGARTRTPGVMDSQSILGVKEALREMKQQYTDTFQQMKTLTLDVSAAIQDGLVGGLQAGINKIHSFGQAMKDMGKSVLLEIQRIILKLIVMRTIGLGLGLLGGAAAAAAPEDTSSMGSIALSIPHAARGTPRTTGRTLAGEGGPEAIIPLPDGRRIPVEIKGGMGGGVTNYFFVSTMDAKSFDQWFRQGAGRNPDVIGVAHASAFQARPELRGKYR